ncbi:MAG TPA: non-homologous end-joining DNA ligase [Acidimicrobiia bacterium]|nr:non-homologous end-joining DNA ligase [Acidimicrobiia bacterium]
MDVTNPDKPMFPAAGHTKADLVRYYATIADRMLPWLAERPLTLERHPDGVDSKGFLQKNASSHFSDRIGRIEVPKAGGTVTHPVVRDEEGLVELANQAVITFHVWTCALPDLAHPTHLVVDLDPEEGDIDAVRRVARTTRSVLGRFDLAAILVASGKKGFHLWAPIEPAEHDDVGMAARALAGLVAAEAPDEATTEFRKRDRGGRVFVDWLRNRRAQTIVCPWSLRVTAGASVATPVDWDELDDIAPNTFTLDTAPSRLPIASPPASPLAVKAIVEAARGVGVDLDSEFDRFGRG